MGNTFNINFENLKNYLNVFASYSWENKRFMKDCNEVDNCVWKIRHVSVLILEMQTMCILHYKFAKM